MKILGIDPGVANTGWGIIEYSESHPQLIECGLIQTFPSQPLPQRLIEIYEEIKKLAHRHSPDCAAVEDIFFSKNAKSAFNVGQVRGCILLALAQVGIPVVEYPPLQVKKALTGYGRAPKSQIQSMVKLILSLEEVPRSDDVADALAIAICHAHSYKLQNAKSKIQNDCRL